MRTFLMTIVALGGALAAAGASAQDARAPAGMLHNMPMQQGQMQQMQQGQQGGTMMTCPMMTRMAAMDMRLRQLEERAGIPTPPAQPGATQ